MAKETLSTHAARNPTRGTQPTRARTGKSSATKKSNVISSSKQKALALAADVELHSQSVNETIQRLAVKHSRKPVYIKKLLTHGKQFKQRRANNIRNAIMHDLSVKAKEAGDDSDLQSILETLTKEEYEEMKQNMSADEHKRIMKQLDDYSRLKRTGIRRTNRALAQDASQTASGIGDVLLDLFERMGVRSCCLFSRSSATDAAVPVIQDSDDAREFFQQALGKDCFNILLKFEQWSCTRDTETKDHDDIQSVRKQIVLLVLDGLRKIRNKKSVAMDYVNYRSEIMHKLGVELAGWPSDIPFGRPIKLTADEGREVRDGLRSGGIRWVVMTKSQRKELAEEMEGEGGKAPQDARRQGQGTEGEGEGDSGGEDDKDEDDEGGDKDKDKGEEEGKDEEEDEEDEEDEALPHKSVSTTITASSSTRKSSSTGKSGAPTRGSKSIAATASSRKSGAGTCAPAASTAAASCTHHAPTSSPVSLTSPAPTTTWLTSTAPAPRSLTNTAPSATSPTSPTPTATWLMHPTPTAFAASLMNGTPAATALMDAMPSATAFTDPTPTAFTPLLTDRTPSAMDFDDPLMNFDHAVYDLDFGMDLSTPTNPSSNGGLGLTDAFGMRPLQTPRFVFPPVHGYGVPPARDSLTLTADDSALGMPPLPGSSGADSGYDAYMASNYAMPRLPNPNPQDYDSDDHAQGTAPPSTLGEATNMEQPAQRKRGRAAEGTDGAPAAKKSRKGGAWTAVTFGDDAQPKPARKTRKRKDTPDAGA
ncbi:hypothetical protein DFH07DRAFT_970650 [Mycena maculata]|uniref:Uncharacterized protein n=1 Tax=Mycena maculata TaxID=230809 RepID=A0AAD7MPD7_9AGAR|nr:hypothetical protein DFH07DRAFT_970650 [Mycena maculata]